MGFGRCRDSNLRDIAVQASIGNRFMRNFRERGDDLKMDAETKTAPCGRRLRHCFGDVYRPSSNATSRLTEMTVSPGDTGVVSALERAAIAIIGTGRSRHRRLR